MKRIALAFLMTAAPSAHGQSVSPAALQAAGLKRRAVEGVPSKDIEVFIDHDDVYTSHVLKALPAFARTGREIFGDKLPAVRLFLMSDEGRYRAFTKAVFNDERTTGTGNFHIVTMCLRCENRRPEETETTAVVLHEFGHAWMNTYLRENYGLDYLSNALRRPYLDEGLADFIADQWDVNFLNRRRKWIRAEKADRGIPPPTIGQLQKYSSFYGEDRNLNYWISDLLIERMIGPGPGSLRKIPLYLDLMGRGETPEQAWESATGKSISAEYAALTRKIWRK